LSADQVGVYKPAPRVYALVPEAPGLAKEAVVFVSSNAFDVMDPKAYAFKWQGRIARLLRHTPWASRRTSCNRTWMSCRRPSRPTELTTRAIDVVSVGLTKGRGERGESDGPT
jgi:FMN phosphatase YigB (HAD superfamily)